MNKNTLINIIIDDFNKFNKYNSNNLYTMDRMMRVRMRITAAGDYKKCKIERG